VKRVLTALQIAKSHALHTDRFDYSTLPKQSPRCEPLNFSSRRLRSFIEDNLANFPLTAHCLTRPSPGREAVNFVLPPGDTGDYRFRLFVPKAPKTVMAHRLLFNVIKMGRSFDLRRFYLLGVVSDKKGIHFLWPQ
jgi:hypothetical protein